LRPCLAILFASILPGIVQGQWVRTAGPEGGHINALASKADTLYAATDGGIYVSANQGASWREIGADLPEARIYGLALQGGLIYANVEGYLWYTADGGAHWTRTAAPYRPTSALAATADAVYTAGLAAEITVSRDSGKTWEKPGIDGYTDYYATAFAADGDRVLAATLSGVFRSADAGRTWQPAWVPRHYPGARDVMIRGTHFLAATDSGLMQSRDTGLTWIRTPLPGDEPEAIEGLAVRSLARDGSTLYAGRPGGAILRSTDSGWTWEAFNLSSEHYRLEALTAFGETLYAGNSHLGVYSHDGPGSPAKFRNTGLVALRAQRVIAGEKNLMVGSETGTRSHSSLFLSGDGGNAWTRLAFPGQEETWSVFDMARGSGRVYAQANYKQFLFSDDDGITWKKLPGEDHLISRSIAVRDDTVYAGFMNGYIRTSLDKGLTWFDSETSRSLDDITALAALGPNVVASGGNGLAYSTDLGRHWTRAFAISGYFLCLGTAGSAMLAGKTEDVLISHDGGATWASYGQGLPTGPGPAPLTFHYHDDVMLLGTAFHGVFKRKAGDARWQPFSEGLRSHYVTSLAVKNGWLYVATRGGGIWKRPWSQISAQSERPKGPAGKFATKVIPGLDATWIDVTVPKAGRYDVTIHGMDGKLLRVVGADLRHAGTHRVQAGTGGFPGRIVVTLRKADRP
jgi:photosystem II stability/assembly factor-like uncharacterized protein